MKKLGIFGAMVLSVGLAGCQSPIQGMLNNNFVAIDPESLPESLVGTWTGNMGPYLVSLKWMADGRGLFCSSYGTADYIQKIKYSQGEILIQDGTKLQIRDHTTELMTVYAPYYAGKESLLYADSNFQHASAYCANALELN